MNRFLSLAKADPGSRQLLQEALQTRYGLRPLALESLLLTLTGQRRGFLGLSIQATLQLAYAEPMYWRYAEKRSFLGFSRGGSVEVLTEAEAYSSQFAAASEDKLFAESLRRQRWAFRALMLTPLTMEGVILRALTESAIEATHEYAPFDAAIIYLHPDRSIAAVEIERYRLSDRRRLPYMIRPQGGLKTFGELVIPAQLAIQWGDEPSELWTVQDGRANPKLGAQFFSLSG
ncbi:MAG: hypothetical protein OHK0023_18400 [Anaerolineae bacterium]